jgi:hypothetical protein
LDDDDDDDDDDHDPDHDDVDINRAWESIRENIKASVTESLGYYELCVVVSCNQNARKIMIY